MRKPGDRVWHMENNKPTEGIIYFIESYLDNEKNPDKKEDPHADYYKLTNKIKNVYYIITDNDIENRPVMDLKNCSTIRHDHRIFDSRKELVESLMED